MFRSMMDALYLIADAFDVCHRSWYMPCTMLMMHAHRYLILDTRSIMMLDEWWWWCLRCHHYCRIIPMRWQVRISLERGTVPELNDLCDMYHHLYVCARSWFNACVLLLSKLALVCHDRGGRCSSRDSLDGCFHGNQVCKTGSYSSITFKLLKTDGC